MSNTSTLTKEEIIRQFYNTTIKQTLNEITLLLNTIYIPKTDINDEPLTITQRINILIERYIDGITERNELFERLVQYEMEINRLQK